MRLPCTFMASIHQDLAHAVGKCRTRGHEGKGSEAGLARFRWGLHVWDRTSGAYVLLAA